MRVWDLASGAPVGALTGHSGPVSSVAVSPDGRRIISGSHDDAVRVWDLATGARVGALTGHSGTVSSVAVSPDGTRIISASHDTTVRVWDLATGAPIGDPLTGHTGPCGRWRSPRTAAASSAAAATARCGCGTWPPAPRSVTP